MTAAASTTCPGCGSTTLPQRFDGQYGRTITIDICQTCNGLWLDGMEGHQLTAGGTLALFRHMARERRAAVPLRARKPCPRCGMRLKPEIDRRQSTTFERFCCPKGHGRYMTFLAFMRAKNFVRDLTPGEVESLKRHVQTIRCASCGAAVDIRTGSACGYCRAPIAMLDPDQLQRTVAELEAAEERRHALDPTLPLRLAEERLKTERVFAELAAEGRASGRASWSLVDTGLRSLAKILDGLGGD